jgi:hypothetical protein
MKNQTPRPHPRGIFELCILPLRRPPASPRFQIHEVWLEGMSVARVKKMLKKLKGLRWLRLVLTLTWTRKRFLQLSQVFEVSGSAQCKSKCRWRERKGTSNGILSEARWRKPGATSHCSMSSKMLAQPEGPHLEAARSCVESELSEDGTATRTW